MNQSYFSDELRPLQWTPEIEEVATWSISDGRESKVKTPYGKKVDDDQNASTMLKSSTVEYWQSKSLTPEIFIDFDEDVSILDVILKPAFAFAEAPSEGLSSSGQKYIFKNMTLSDGRRFQPEDMTKSFKNIV